MNSVFSTAGRAALGATLRNEPLLAFDFDGTLAPLVARPDAAQVPPALASRMVRLGRLRPVAIVTGRSVVDIRQRLGFPVAYIAGNHGAEVPGTGSVLDPFALDPARERIELAASTLRAAGVQVEDKRYSLALHYRQASDRVRALALIDELLSGLPAAIRMVPGRMVRNLVLADAPDKGDAVIDITRRAGCGSAFFVGDDANDETVFAKALPDWLTVRVGRDDAQSAARFFLEGHGEVAGLLDCMLDVLERRA